jgi:putative ABC transport system permease protein
MSVPDRLPALVRTIFRTLLPIAEREEVLADMEAEYRQRAAAEGVGAARRWARRQAIGSLPALLQRGWWRGTTGFEPRANRMRPGGPMFESWIMDCRYAGRRLLSRPAYAVLAVLTLALGAGGTAAVFSIARTLLLDPLPIADEQRLAVFWMNASWTEQEFLHFRPHFPGFKQVTAYRPNDVTLEMPGSAMKLLPGVSVSAEFFDVLGAKPMLGRTFQATDDAVGPPPAAVLSHSLWQELGSDPAIAGRQLRIGGIPRTVVGVMPRGFWFPSPLTRIWTAAQLNPRNRSGIYTLVGRLADGASMDNMHAPLRAFADALAAQFTYSPQWDKTRAPAITPVREFLVGDLRPSIRATFAAMAVILLIACGNVAALMLGQVDARAIEMAVRAALGANRQRLVQQLIIESLLVGTLAGLTGAALAIAGFELLVASLPLGALADNARLDWTVFWASMLAALAAAVIVAIVPGIALWRGSRLQATMATTRTGGIAGRGGRLEGGLVVAQMALGVLLAAGAGLLIRSVTNLRAIDPGVHTDAVAVVDAVMPLAATPLQRKRVVLDMLPVLQALPGVKAAAAAQKLPLRGSGDNWIIRIQGRTDDKRDTTAFRMVTRDYFTTLGMPIRRGRNFDASDREGGGRVVIINEALAAKFFPHEDPVGRVIMTFDDRGERIVGVVANAAEANLTDAPAPARYMLYEQLPFVYSGISFVLSADSEQHIPGVLYAARSAIGREGVQLAAQETTTMKRVFELAVGPAVQIVTLLTILAGLALVLGAVGVYGVMSHYVTRRSRDYGICLALGLQPARVVRQVLGRGAALVGIGSAIGVAGALAVTKVLASLLYGVQPTDPIALAGAVGVLLVVGMLAAFIPARRASLTDPAVVLRE